MIVAVLQARRGSTRLPDKILLPLCGQPMILRQIERLRRSRGIDRLAVATTTQPRDGAVEQLCAEHGVDCFRGSEEDVLDRVYQAAAARAPRHVARLTADCPLSDPEVIDRVIDAHLRSGSDYTSNTLRRTYPDGLDVEVMTLKALDIAQREATRAYDREHVTPFLYRQPDRFRLHNVSREPDLSRLRWTVDVAEDYRRVSKIYEALHPEKSDFTFEDILAFEESRS